METGTDNTELHHHPGLAEDLARMQQRIVRRRMLGWVVSGGTLALLGACGGTDSASGTASTTTTGGTSGSGSTTTGTISVCVELPDETNGPFPADGTNSISGSVVNVLTQSGVVRSDITTSFGSSSTIAAGVPLTLTVTLEDTGAACSLLSG